MKKSLNSEVASADEAALLLDARRVTRWMVGWRPRLRAHTRRVLFVGSSEIPAPGPSAASAQWVHFDPERQCEEVVRALAWAPGSPVGPEVFDALIERLCLEVYLADLVVIQPTAQPAIALVTAGAVDALGGRPAPGDGASTTALEAALADWTVPADASWVPVVLAEAAVAERLRRTLDAALSSPLAAL